MAWDELREHGQRFVLSERRPGGLLIRRPRPADEQALLELLRQVDYTSLEVADEIARAAAQDERLDPSPLIKRCYFT
ncbi:hypothetical protein ACFCYB_41905 [Streptomyces sp. NPDC056309]|uniref:hypothetical protein n=1 Tax=unclassified Streptomyces TaxID=2593676 RepID=UPI0035DBBC93